MNDAKLRDQRIVRNSAFNLGGQALTIIAGLICVPITFRQLRPEQFGLLTIVWSMLSYAIVFDLGTGPAVSRATAASLATEGGRRVRAIVRAGMLVQSVLGLATALVLAVLAKTLIAWMKIPPELSRDGTNALYVLAAALPFVLLAQSQQAVLEGLERFDLIAYVRTPVAIATYLIPAIGAVSGWSLAQMMVGVLFSRVAALVLMNAMYRRTALGAQHGSMRDELPGLFRYGKWLAVSGVLTQLLIYLDRFLLSGMRGLAAVGQYGAPYDAATKLLVFPGSIGVAMFPRLAKDAASNNDDDAVARSRKAARLFMLVLVPVCAVLIALAGPILHAWLGPRLGPEGVMAFRVLVIATLFHALSYPPVILIEAFGRSDVIAWYYLAELVVYIPILVLSIKQAGVVGAAAAWAMRTAALMAWSHWYARGFMLRRRSLRQSIITGEA